MFDRTDNQAIYETILSDNVTHCSDSYFVLVDKRQISYGDSLLGITTIVRTGHFVTCIPFYKIQFYFPFKDDLDALLAFVQAAILDKIVIFLVNCYAYFTTEWCAWSNQEPSWTDAG